MLYRRYLAALDRVFAQENLFVDDSVSNSSNPNGAPVGTYWLIQDRLGTVRNVIDNNRVIWNHAQYDAFGNRLSLDYPHTNPATPLDRSITRFGFTGQEYDEVTGLTWYSNGDGNGNWLDPRTNTWIKRDALPVRALNPNAYVYAANGPTNFVDPSGQGLVGPGFPGTPGYELPTPEQPRPVQGPPLPPSTRPQQAPLDVLPEGIRGIDEIIDHETATGVGPTEAEVDYYSTERFDDFVQWRDTMRPNQSSVYNETLRRWDEHTIGPVYTEAEQQQRHLSKLYEEGGWGMMIFGQGGSLDQFTGVMGGFACPFPGEAAAGPAAKQKGVPNPHGRHGSPPHRAKVAERADKLEAKGHEITAGGGRLPEKAVGEPGQRRFPDISTKAPSGEPYHENIGRETQEGKPIAREQRALDDIEAATGTKPGFTPFKP
ncbi:MAG: hypothetical protein K2Y37_17270 [Pirellulales bacterium]|nr:hypothetical protein [Pirellulales bacterium]